MEKLITNEECLLAPNKKHNFKDWSLEWAKCRDCGKTITKDELNAAKKHKEDEEPDQSLFSRS